MYMYLYTLKAAAYDLASTPPKFSCWLRSLPLEYEQILPYPQQLGPIKSKSVYLDNHKGLRVEQ